MTVVRIGSASECLVLSPDLSDPIVQTVTAELVSNGLHATRTVVHSFVSGFADLATFFGDLERDWRGWDGTRAWNALEGDLIIEARHEHLHVHLRVTLRTHGPGWGGDGWSATADLTIDPGEQLSRVAADLRRLARWD